jgi:signal transduction histidine kinase
VWHSQSYRVRDVHIDLQKKFVVAHLLLLCAGCLAYLALATHGYRVVALLVLLVGTSAVASWLVSYAVFTPMRQLLITARAVRAGEASSRVGVDRDDEIGSLARELHAIGEQLQAAKSSGDALIGALEQLRHADRIATLGRLASSVAHELGNPLNVIELRAQLISSGDADTLHQAQQSALVIVEQTRRMTRIIEQILSFARMQPTRVVRLELVGVLHKALELCAHTSKKHKTQVWLDTTAAAIEIDGDPDKLLQIIVNLIVNGIQAMPGGGTLRVNTGEVVCAPINDPSGALRHYVFIDVVDQGHGIPAETALRVFEPFFSTKGAEGGTGLGLSVAQGIAQEHEGWISFESQVGRGTSFKVHLPGRGPKPHEHHAN